MYIVANWKAYVEDRERAQKLFAVSKRLLKTGDFQIVLAPPAPLLSALSSRKSSISFAAQDVSLTTGGAHTGENTAAAYAAAGASYAIIGHSERRRAGETDAMVAEKIAHSLVQGLTPILCIGESERDGEGRYLSFIREQITAALTPLAPKDRSKIIIAYEPVWAIGKSAAEAINPNDLAEMALYIKKVVSELLPGKGQSRVPVLYGGSVEGANVRDLAGGSHIDGFLIGRASVDPVTFTALLKQLR